MYAEHKRPYYVARVERDNRVQTFCTGSLPEALDWYLKQMALPVLWHRAGSVKCGTETLVSDSDARGSSV